MDIGSIFLIFALLVLVAWYVSRPSSSAARFPGTPAQSAGPSMIYRRCWQSATGSSRLLQELDFDYHPRQDTRGRLSQPAQFAAAARGGGPEPVGCPPAQRQSRPAADRLEKAIAARRAQQNQAARQPRARMATACQFRTTSWSARSPPAAASTRKKPAVFAPNAANRSKSLTSSAPSAGPRYDRRWLALTASTDNSTDQYPLELHDQVDSHLPAHPSPYLTACSFSLAEDITPPPGAQQPVVQASTQEAPTGPLYPLVPPDPAAGAANFAEKCAPCHGDTGLGDGPSASELPVPVAPSAPQPWRAAPHRRNGTPWSPRVTWSATCRLSAA